MRSVFMFDRFAPGPTLRRALLRCAGVWMVVVAWPGVAEAQLNRRGSSKELGYQLGTMWYVGDLNPSNVLRGTHHVAQGVYYRHNVNSRLAVRGQFMQGTVEMWDADHPNAWQQQRNLHFRNEISEYAVLAELNYRNHVVGRPSRNVTPFLYAGLAVYTHDPEGQDAYGNWQPLQPLGTEGQGWYQDVEVYSLGGVALPLGIGWKGNLGEAMSFQVEYGARKVWTDYLDDVSTVYMNPSLLREARGQTAVDFADRSLAHTTPAGAPIEGLQRGDPGRDDRYGYFLVSLAFRVSKKATTCWEQ